MRSFISIILIFISISGTAGIDPVQKTKIVFRFDDYRLRTDAISDSLIYIFGKNKIPLCLGIIPYDYDGIIYNQMNPEQLIGLRERINKNDVEIALHGFNHADNKLITHSFLKKSGPSEFNNLNFDEQYKKIKRGKSALDSLLNTDVDIFIPPFDSYDNTTLNVLDSLKFRIISASIDGPSNSKKIAYIPFTVSELTELPKIIRTSRYDNMTIVVLLHPYSFKGEYPGLVSRPVYISKLDSVLSWIKNQNYIVTTNFSTLSRSEVFDNNRFVSNSTNNNLVIKILNKLKIYRYGIFDTTGYLKNHQIIFILLNLLFHVILFSSIYFPTKMLAKILKPFYFFRLLFVTVIIAISLGILYKGINSHGFITYFVLMVTISSGFLFGILRGNQLSLEPQI